MTLTAMIAMPTCHARARHLRGAIRGMGDAESSAATARCIALDASRRARDADYAPDWLEHAQQEWSRAARATARAMRADAILRTELRFAGLD